MDRGQKGWLLIIEESKGGPKGLILGAGLVEKQRYYQDQGHLETQYLRTFALNRPCAWRVLPPATQMAHDLTYFEFFFKNMISYLLLMASFKAFPAYLMSLNQFYFFFSQNVVLGMWVAQLVG